MITIMQSTLFVQGTDFKFSTIQGVVILDVNKDIQNKINKFHYICGNVKNSEKFSEKKTALLNSLRKFYEIMAVPVLLYSRESWIKKQRDKAACNWQR